MTTPKANKQPVTKAPSGTAHAQPEELTDEQVPDSADAADAQTAYSVVLPVLAGILESTVFAPTIDVFAATDRARQLHAQMMADKPLVARFHGIAGLQTAEGIREFNIAFLTELTTRSLAASHARSLLVKARKVSLTRVPKATVDEATTVCKRMKALAVHLFSKHPKEAVKVADILAGSGYHDLADDLRELAALYARHPDIVVKDSVNYVATDKADAERLAREIIAALGHDPTLVRTSASKTAARAWTYFWQAWSEVAGLGRWLLRDTPDRASTLFPMLLGEVRAAPQPGAPAASAGADVTPAVGAAPAAAPPAATAKSKPRKKARGKKH